MELPIIFSGPMIPPIIADTKIQTRRLTGLDKVNDDPEKWKFIRMMNYADGTIHAIFENNDDDTSVHIKSPYGTVDDVLWVRESFMKLIHYDRSGEYGYKAELKDNADKLKWKPSIHMPRSACRLFLLNKGTGIQRIQDISEEDCIKEGVRFDKDSGYYFVGDSIMEQSAKAAFIKLWNSIHGQWKWSIKKNAFVCYPWEADDTPLIPKKYSLERDLISTTFKASPNPFVWAVDFSRIQDYKK